MKGVNVLELSQEEAEIEYKKYVEAVKTRKEKYLEDLKKVYHSLKNGRKVIDVFESFKNAGTNEDNEPRLAISQAGMQIVYFYKRNDGSGRFSNDPESWNWRVSDVTLPSRTWNNWEREKFKDSEGILRNGSIKNETIKTQLPVIPAHLLPEGKLNNYYLLWEVKEWEALPPQKDPFLLRRISPNLFSVLAEWELTEIEQAVIRGRQ